jgi:transcription elongation factor Elf1
MRDKHSLQGIYRCPVCGHRDSVEIDVQGVTHRISCSYCDTQLDVTVRSPSTDLLSARLAENPLPS